MKFTGTKLKMSDNKRQFYYDVDSKWFLKVLQSNDQDLPILYETTHDLYTRDEKKHILFPSAIFFWPKQVAILFERTSVDLFTFTHNNVLSEGDIAYTIKCLLSALTYLHSKNIIHCDIKRENTVICLTSHTPKLIDFEYATHNDPITKIRREKEFGTVFAPEMTAREWNNSVDFYCVGYLFRELCSTKYLKSKFSHIYKSMIHEQVASRIGFNKTEGFKSTPIITAINLCRVGETKNYDKYSELFIKDISKLSEDVHKTTVTIDLLQ